MLPLRGCTGNGARKGMERQRTCVGGALRQGCGGDRESVPGAQGMVAMPLSMKGRCGRKRNGQVALSVQSAERCVRTAVASSWST